MEHKKRNLCISIILVLVAVIFTILVKVVDVQPVGVNETNIGFATINQFMFNTIGENMMWYNITEVLGYLAICVALAYGLIGMYQLIKRKSLFKVDKEIIALGIFYIIVVAVYIFFENAIINYRPILIDGAIEASYPSSHTLMTICLCGSSIIVNKKLFNNKYTKIINISLVAIILITVIGRLISGVHWFTDIIGGLFIAQALLMILYSVINLLKKSNV